MYLNEWQDHFNFGSQGRNKAVEQKEVALHPMEDSNLISVYQESNAQSVLSVNWECWKDDKGNWVFDISEVAGPAGQSQIQKAVNIFIGNIQATQGIAGPCFPGLGGC